MFLISPYAVSALQEVLHLVGQRIKSPVVLQKVGKQPESDELHIRIIGSGEAYRQGCKCASACERGEVYIAPPRNSRGKHLGKVGEQVLLRVECYDVGVWLHPKYGLQYIYRMSGTGGVELTWTTKQKINFGKYKLQGKVKAHQNFSNNATTALFYCKLTPIGGNNVAKRSDSNSKTKQKSLRTSIKTASSSKLKENKNSSGSRGGRRNSTPHRRGKRSTNVRKAAGHNR